MSKEIPSEGKRTIFSKWWVSVLLAITVYMGLKYLVPGLFQEDSPLFKICQTAPNFAPLASIPFLLLAAKQLYDTELPQEEIDESNHSTRED